MKAQYTRTEIFDLLWETPTTKIAKQLGISDVALTKWCAKNGIPKPPLGYWAKKEHGKPVPPKPTLAPWESGGSQPVYCAHDPNLKPSPAPLSAELSVKLANALSLPGISATANEDAPLGSVTRRTAKALDRKPDVDGFLYGKNDTFNVRISTENKDRVIRILNTLELSLAAAGMKWEQKENQRGVVGHFLEETIVFSIVEASSRTEHVEKHPTYDWMNKRTYTYQFLGDLKIAIDGYYEGRKSWRDGKTQRLEEKLPQVIEGFIAAAEAMRRRTEERKAQHIRWEEEAAIRREKERIAYERQQFLDGALKEARAWSEAAQLRQYVAHLREVVAVSQTELTDYGKNWLNRADEAIGWLDPTEKWRGKTKESNVELEDDDE
ncbi:MAG: hypothetical protein PHI29_04575 [Gallionella sp.]|nr:hypothetical protein [Gallionella sp.]